MIPDDLNCGAGLGCLDDTASQQVDRVIGDAREAAHAQVRDEHDLTAPRGRVIARAAPSPEPGVAVSDCDRGRSRLRPCLSLTTIRLVMSCRYRTSEPASRGQVSGFEN